MIDRDKVVKGLEYHLKELTVGKTCYECSYCGDNPCELQLIADALEQIQAYQQLLEWAVECGFGYDNIPEMYKQYKNEIDGMSYTDGLLYLASRSLEKGKSNV